MDVRPHLPITTYQQRSKPYLPDVGSRQSSVRKGEAGKPALLYRLHHGFIPHAYRTATGCSTMLLCTTTVSPSTTTLLPTFWSAVGEVITGASVRRRDIVTGVVASAWRVCPPAVWSRTPFW